MNLVVMAGDVPRANCHATHATYAIAGIFRSIDYEPVRTDHTSQPQPPPKSAFSGHCPSASQPFGSIRSPPLCKALPLRNC